MMNKSRVFLTTNRPFLRAAALALSLALFFLALSAALLPGVSYGDVNAPPDERVPVVDSAAEKRAQLERERAERERKARLAAEAQRRAAEAKRLEDARKAAEAKRRLEAEQKRIAAAEAELLPMKASRSLVASGRYRSAVFVLKRYLAQHEDAADGWYLLARAYHALGDYEKAQETVNIVLDKDPYYPDLVKTPNGLRPNPTLTKRDKRRLSKEPRPIMSVLPIKPVLPANILLEPVIISFPVLIKRDNPSWGKAAQDGLESSYMDPDGMDPINGAYLEYRPMIPNPLGATVEWMQSERFNEISRWRFRVDRMGILMTPRVPVAWKGAKPYEVYFWTGDEWARVRMKDDRLLKRNPYDILFNAQESIAEVLTDRGFVWREEDTPALSAAASFMRYRWAGNVDLIDAELRAVAKEEKRAKKAGREGVNNTQDTEDVYIVPADAYAAP
ncbi:hypothetical protein FACS1894216_15690 [Synergistales bacterium]|nr:hypothetical protein FACS1894216_15690 [Synergistales bacterium]